MYNLRFIFLERFYNIGISRDVIVTYLERIVFITRRRVAAVRRRETVVSPSCKYCTSNTCPCCPRNSVLVLRVVFECNCVTLGRHRNNFCCCLADVEVLDEFRAKIKFHICMTILSHLWGSVMPALRNNLPLN